MPDNNMTLRAIVLLILGLPLLVSCSSSPSLQTADGAPEQVPNLDHVTEPVPRDEPPSKYGNPESYVVNGQTYYTQQSSVGYVERGIASWYGTKFHGRRTSSGEPYDMYQLTAAHKTLPLPTYARVTNLQNQRSIIVKINDRGPFHENRLVDLSYAAAHKLGILANGTGLVELRAIDPSAPEPPPTVAAAPPAKLQGVGLYLQVGAFANLTNAKALQNRLNQADISNTLLSRIPVSNAWLYRVRIGPISDVEKADQLASMVVAMGIQNPQIIID
jgi:rare lipoprotein A